MSTYADLENAAQIFAKARATLERRKLERAEMQADIERREAELPYVTKRMSEPPIIRKEHWTPRTTTEATEDWQEKTPDAIELIDHIMGHLERFNVEMKRLTDRIEVMQATIDRGNVKQLN